MRFLYCFIHMRGEDCSDKANAQTESNSWTLTPHWCLGYDTAHLFNITLAKFQCQSACTIFDFFLSSHLYLTCGLNS